MLTASQVLAEVESLIAAIYRRPFMYGFTGAQVDTLLHYLHLLWSIIVERKDAFFDASIQIHSAEERDSDSFANNYAVKHPNATESDQMEYVVARWQEVGQILGIGKSRPIG